VNTNVNLHHIHKHANVLKDFNLYSWGAIPNGNPRSLKKMPFYRLPNNRCDDTENTSVICAKVQLKSGFTCQGDSGGALIAKIDGSFFLIGILNSGETGCSKGNQFKPNRFTDIASNLKFIEDIISKYDEREENKGTISFSYYIMILLFFGAVMFWGLKKPAMLANRRLSKKSNKDNSIV